MPERPVDPALERSTNIWMGSGLVFMLVMVLAFPVYRLIEPSRRDAQAAERTSELARQGEELFALACANCHGQAGGGGAGSPTLNAKEFLQSAADAQIESLIATGVPGTTMAAYSLDFGGPFTQEQIVALTVYIRSLEPDAPSVPNWQVGGVAGVAAPEPTAPADSDISDAILEMGLLTYAAFCANCHGLELEGGLGPALGAGSDVQALSNDEIEAVIANGRGSMRGFASLLTDEETLVLIAYIRSQQEED